MDRQLEIKKRIIHVMMLSIVENWNGIRSQKDFAEVIDTAPQQLLNIKNTEGRSFTLPMIQHLCEKLNVNANFIFTGSLPIRNSKTTSDQKIAQIKSILEK